MKLKVKKKTLTKNPKKKRTKMKEKKFMRDCNWKTKLNKIKLLQKKIRMK
jgi:hypothetical protein